MSRFSNLIRQAARHRVLRNMSWLAVSYALAKPLWFVFITAVCMRLLTPEGYGIFTASLALAMLTSSIGDLGTSRYSTREIARSARVASRLFTNILVGRLALALAGFLIAVLIGIMLDYPPAQLWAVVGAGIYAIAFRATEYCRAFFQAFEVLRYEAILTIVEKVAVVTLGFAALFVFRTPAMAFAGMGTGMLIALAAHVWWVDRRLARFSKRLLSGRYITRVVVLAIPIGLIGVLGAVPAGALPVIVDATLGSVAAGLYGAAQRIIEALNLLTTILVVAIFPRFSAMYHQGRRDGMGRLLRISLSGGFVMGIGVTIVLVLAAEEIIALLAASAAYADAAALLGILALGYPFMSLTMVSVSALIAMDALKYATISMGMGAVVSVSMTFALIPLVGTGGAAAAFASGWVVTALANIFECRRRLLAMPVAEPDTPAGAVAHADDRARLLA